MGPGSYKNCYLQAIHLQIICVCVYIYIYTPTPLHEQDVPQGQFFMQILIGLNSEFSF